MLFTVVLNTFFKYIMEIRFIPLLVNKSVSRYLSVRM